MKVISDTRELVQFGHALGELGRSGLRYAMKGVVNDQAFHGRKVSWPETASEGLILRKPKATLGSFGVRKAQGRVIEAALGSGRPYMATLEDGDMQAAKGKHGVPIPAAAPGVRGSIKHRAKARDQLANLTLMRGAIHGDRKQRNAIALAQARSKGGGVIFLETEKGHKGLFRVRGGNPRKSRAMPRKIWDLTHKTVNIPPHTTLQAAAQIELRRAPIYWVSNLGKQVQFQRGLKSKLKRK